MRVLYWDLGLDTLLSCKLVTICKMIDLTSEPSTVLPTFYIRQFLQLSSRFWRMGLLGLIHSEPCRSTCTPRRAPDKWRVFEIKRYLYQAIGRYDTWFYAFPCFPCIYFDREIIRGLGGVPCLPAHVGTRGQDCIRPILLQRL
jgi:hypothetical protein